MTTEIYEVIKTDVIVCNGHTFKMEILHDQNVLDKNHFCSRIHYQVKTSAPTLFPDDHLGKQPILWTYVLDFPQVRADTIEGAQNQSMSLIDQCYGA